MLDLIEIFSLLISNKMIQEAEMIIHNTTTDLEGTI